MGRDVYVHVKEKLIEGKLKYPELALYENFMRHNSSHWLRPENSELVHDKIFGISVIPVSFNNELHNGVTLIQWLPDGNSRSHSCLSHQCYLHDMLLKLWKGEATGFNIVPEFKSNCVVAFNK